jgi:hypothetical protein
MIRILAGLLLIAVCGLGCRTNLSAQKQAEAKKVYIGDRECMVYDFNASTDVPDGAKNLGWVSVKTTGNDEETFIKLREQVCQLGGDALSSVAWVREANEYEPTTLKGNAWSLP